MYLVFSLKPNPSSYFTIWMMKFSEAMLQSISPLSYIFFSTRPTKYSKPISLIVCVTPLINPTLNDIIIGTIRKSYFSIPMHLGGPPFSSIDSSIWPKILACSMHFILIECSYIFWSILESHLTVSLSESSYVIAFINTSISQSLLPFSMW